MTTAIDETTEAPAFDPERAEAFAGKLVGILNDACTALCLSVGHRSGLFDAMAGLPPSTSAAIASAAGLNERYVRELLGNLTLAGIVEYDAAQRTYALPAEHAAFTTSAAGPDNLAFMTQYVSLMAQVEGGIVDCVRNGGGLTYAAYPEFQTLQRAETAPVYDATLVQRTLPAVPGLVERLEAGIDVADIGCGGGHAVNVMARAFPNSRFTGFDFSEEGLALGRAEAAGLGLGNARFEAADAATLDRSEAFDLITAFDAIHDQVAPRAVLANIRRALRPGGIFLMVDIAAQSALEDNYEHMLGPTLFTFSLFHCMTVSLAHGGEGLGTMWGEQKARELLAEAGFTNVEATTIEGDLINTYYICRP